MRRIAFGIALLSACALAMALAQRQLHEESVDPMALHASGVGPLLLGGSFLDAERSAFRLAAESAFSGTGCGGLAEIRYDGWLGEHFVGVMAMTGDDRIASVEISLHETRRARNLDECLLLRDGFAAPFLDRFGAFDSRWQVIKPVAREAVARTGPVVITARWFDTGGDCQVSARYGERLEDGTRGETGSVSLRE